MKMKTKLDIFHGFSDIPTDYEGACYITELETVFYLKDQFTRHSIDSPAIIVKGRTCFWYENGVRHRLWGPAVTGIHGYEVFILNGKELEEEEFLKTIQKLQEEISFLAVNLKKFHDQGGFRRTKP